MAVEIKNKKALFQYFILEEFTAGIVLTGSEIKSIRAGKANIAEAYCKLNGNSLIILNMNIAHYGNAGYAQHEERRVKTSHSGSSGGGAEMTTGVFFTG